MALNAALSTVLVSVPAIVSFCLGAWAWGAWVSPEQAFAWQPEFLWVPPGIALGGTAAAACCGLILYLRLTYAPPLET